MPILWRGGDLRVILEMTKTEKSTARKGEKNTYKLISYDKIRDTFRKKMGKTCSRV